MEGVMGEIFPNKPFLLKYPLLEKWVYIFEVWTYNNLTYMSLLNGFVLENPQNTLDFSYDIMSWSYGHLK